MPQLAAAFSALLCRLPLDLLAQELPADPAAANPNMTTWITLIAGVLLIILVMARRRIINRRATGRTPPPVRQSPSGSARMRTERQPAPAADPRAADQRQLNDSMQSLMLDLEELSRQVGGQIDTRLRALNLLIEEADRKIAELKGLGLKSAAAGESAEVVAPAAAGRAADDNATAPRAAEDATSRKYARVHELAARGQSVIDIAREMEMMTGEVELILALQRSFTHRSEGASR